MIWAEAELVVEREVTRIATSATILQAAANIAASAFSKDGGKGANKRFAKLIKDLGGFADSETARAGGQRMADIVKKGRKSDGR